jgi:hypothetical protein
MSTFNSLSRISHLESLPFNYVPFSLSLLPSLSPLSFLFLPPLPLPPLHLPPLPLPPLPIISQAYFHSPSSIEELGTPEEGKKVTFQARLASLQKERDDGAEEIAQLRHLLDKAELSTQTVLTVCVCVCVFVCVDAEEIARLRRLLGTAELCTEMGLSHDIVTLFMQWCDDVLTLLAHCSYTYISLLLPCHAHEHV